MKKSNYPKIAVLKWESGYVPKGLMQLESLKGNSTNPDTYVFPVKLVEVKGANVDTIITNPSEKILSDMIEICNSLKKEGIKVITTSCGFNAIFQKKFSQVKGVTVLSSALLQLPSLLSAFGDKQEIAIITANKKALTKEHFAAVGVDDLSGILVFGLEESKEWNKIFSAPDEMFDMEFVKSDIAELAGNIVKENKDIAAFLLECTDLPPFAEDIRKITGLPVYDYVTLVMGAAMSIGELSLV